MLGCEPPAFWPRNGNLLYRFGDFALDTDRRELHRGPDFVPVAPQVFDLLEYLIENRNRVVSKDELIAAVWGGRIVSDSALSTRINAVRCAIDDTGEEQRLVRTVPRKGVRFVGVVHEAQAAESAIATGAAVDQPRPALPLPDKPSIAVLPFTNMSGDPDQDYFADGMVEEIITALSRLRWLFVIARNSSFAYKGRAVDVKQVGRELGVRYVLEGSVRKSANRVRITGQLIDASTGTHIWADRFDGALDDVFDLQDRVTENVMGAISPRMEQAEFQRAKGKPTGSLDAYDYFLHGKAIVAENTEKAVDQALDFFYRAIEFDPNFASAHGMAAWCYHLRKANRWRRDVPREIAEATRLARKAVDLGRDDAVALSSGGLALAYIGGDLDAGAVFIDRALALNPNLAHAWIASAWLRINLGEPELAIRQFEHVMRLSPFEPMLHIVRGGIAFAYFIAGDYDKACSLADRLLREKPDMFIGLRVAAAANALAGRLERSHVAMARLRQLDPRLRMSDIADLTPFRRPQDLTRHQEAMRMAGLPE
jgi:TolB-like protein